MKANNASMQRWCKPLPGRAQFGLVVLGARTTAEPKTQRGKARRDKPCQMSGRVPATVSQLEARAHKIRAATSWAAMIMSARGTSACGPGGGVRHDTG